MTPDGLAQEIRRRAKGQGRFIAALAGAPGAGKSTLAATLVAELGTGARLIPMDGFHLDNAVLDARGLRAVKGAPQTFDAAGFVNLMQRLRVGGEVAIPVFDRAADLARAGAETVTDADRILVVEGNYLLLDQAPWRDVPYDLTVFLDVPKPELERRLVQRWLRHGMAPDAAQARALSNDIPNAQLVLRHSRGADLTVQAVSF